MSQLVSPAGAYTKLISGRDLEDGVEEQADGVEEKAPRPSTHDEAIVQFAAPLYFTHMEAKTLKIGIMRLGSMNKRSMARWTTISGSALSGEDFEQTQGDSVWFEVGEDFKEVEVDILYNTVWHATLEFIVKLSQPDGCVLGRATTRIKLIDEITFPSHTYKDNIDVHNVMDSVKALNMYGLFWSYCKLNLAAGHLKWQIILTLIMDQMKNLHLLLCIYLQMYLVNVVFNVHDEGVEQNLLLPSRAETAYLVGSLYAVPMAFLHVWEYMKLKLDIRGDSVVFLRSSLFRRYLNYSDESRLQTDTYHIILCILEDTDSVAKGFMVVLELIQLMGKLAIQTSFLLLKNPKAWWVVIVVPLVTILWSIVREKQAFFIKGSTDPKTDICNFVSDTSDNMELIEDYGQREVANRRFQAKVLKARNSVVPKALFQLNTLTWIVWLMPVTTATYIYCSATSVLDKTVSLGTFLATLAIIKSVAGDAEDGYRHFRVMTHTFKPLSRITIFLNTPTDLAHRRQVSDERLKRSYEEIRERTQPPQSQDLKMATDDLAITLEKVTFRYGGRDSKDEFLFTETSFTVRQGSSVGIFGDHNRAKATLLRLIAYKIYPTSGHVIVPAHLQIVHVALDPVAFRMSVYSNLTCGVHDHHDPAITSHARVRAVLTRLGMVETLRLVGQQLDAPENEVLDPEAETTDYHHHKCLWRKVLPASELSLLHLARALIANAEVTVLQRPMMRYHPAMKRLVRDIMLEHVRERGIEMPSHLREVRRPRTLFFTAEDAQALEGVDIIWKLETAPGTTSRSIQIKEVHLSTVTSSQDWNSWAREQH